MTGDGKPDGEVVCSRCFRAMRQGDAEPAREVPRPKPRPSSTAPPPTPSLTPEEWKRLLADEVQAFVDARLPLAEETLSKEELLIFRSMTYVQQAVLVFSCVREGRLG